MREQKFTFISEDAIKAPRASVTYRVALNLARNAKGDVNYNLYFPAEVVRDNDLAGKHLKFYIDEQGKHISWRVIDGHVPPSDILTAREVKPSPSGTWVASITKLLKHAKREPKERVKDIPVKVYDTTELMERRRYYYIRIP